MLLLILFQVVVWVLSQDILKSMTAEVDNVSMILRCPQVIQIMAAKCMNNKQPWAHQGPPHLPQDSVRQGPHAIIYLCMSEHLKQLTSSEFDLKDLSSPSCGVI